METIRARDNDAGIRSRRTNAEPRRSPLSSQVASSPALVRHVLTDRRQAPRPTGS